MTRYELQPEGIPTRLVLLDTVGYAHTGPKEDQLRATREAAQHSDVLLLVLHARNPARQADLSMLQELRQWFAARPDLKMPRVLAVLTHIDLLSPAMDWSPPYNWERPQRPKEKSIDAATAAVREQLGEYLVGVVPVCVAAGKVYGVEEWLLPALTEMLDEAHAVGLLRVLRIEFDAEKVRKVIRQMKSVALEAGKLLWRTLTTPAPPRDKAAPRMRREVPRGESGGCGRTAVVVVAIVDRVILTCAIDSDRPVRLLSWFDHRNHMAEEEVPPQATVVEAVHP